MKYPELYRLHAEICRTLAHPGRLEILNLLRGGGANASALAKRVGMGKTNLSQHMKLLVQKGVVVAEKKGASVFYRIADARIVRACDLMRAVLIQVLEKSGRTLKDLQRAAKSV